MENVGESRRGCNGGGCPKAAAQPEQNTTFEARAERRPSVTLHTRAPFAAVVPPPASTPRSPPRQGVALQASLINRLSYFGTGKSPRRASAPVREAKNPPERSSGTQKRRGLEPLAQPPGRGTAPAGERAT